MRILEDNELNYSIDDIVDAISGDVGFSMVKTTDTKGYFMLGSQIKLSVNFDNDGEITAELNLPSEDYDMTEGYSQVEMISTAIESAVQIVEIIRRMSKEDN